MLFIVQLYKFTLKTYPFRDYISFNLYKCPLNCHLGLKQIKCIGTIVHKNRLNHVKATENQQLQLL